MKHSATTTEEIPPVNLDFSYELANSFQPFWHEVTPARSKGPDAIKSLPPVKLLRAVLVERWLVENKQQLSQFRMKRQQIEASVETFTDRQVNEMLTFYGPVLEDAKPGDESRSGRAPVGVTTMEADSDDRSQLTAMLFNYFFGVNERGKKRATAKWRVTELVGTLSDPVVSAALRFFSVAYADRRNS